MDFDVAKIEQIAELDNKLTVELQALFNDYTEDAAKLTTDSPHNRILIALLQTALAKASYDFLAKQGVNTEEALQTVALLTGNAMEAWFLKALSQQDIQLEGINVQKLN